MIPIGLNIECFVSTSLLQISPKFLTFRMERIVAISRRCLSSRPLT